MNGEIARFALDGLHISIVPDCWPLSCKAGGIRLSMTAQTWNGSRTLNQAFTREELSAAENPDELITRAIQGMAEVIRTPWDYKPE